MLRDMDWAVLSEATARNVPLALSIPSGGALLHFKARFLQMTKEGIWIDLVPVDKALLAKLSADRLGVAVAFKSGALNYLFTTNLASATERIQLHADMASVPALRLELPSELKTIQRRAAYRTRVSPDDLSFAAWRVDPDADLTDNPVASQQLNAYPRDISLGGIGVLLRPVWGEPPVVTPGERLQTELASLEGKIVLEGRLRGGRNSKETGGVIAGIQWVLPQDHLKAAQITGHLEKLVNRLQRQELRRGKPPNLRIA